MKFQYDAADHLLSIHDGTITVTGAINESLDLSDDPVSGMAPVGSFATNELTPGAMVGNMTEFTAMLTQPTIFSDTCNVDAGITTLPVTVDVTGQVIATATIALDLGGGAVGPGDYNGGGAVEQADLDLVLSTGGRRPPTRPRSVGSAIYPTARSIRKNWTVCNTAAVAAASVPEPATLLLVAPLAVCAVAFFNRSLAT